MSDIKVLDIVVNKDATNYKYINSLSPDAREVVLEIINQHPSNNITYTDIDSFIIIELVKLGAVPIFSLVKQELAQNTIKMPVTTYGINITTIKMVENNATGLTADTTFDNMVEIVSKNTDMTILYFFIPMFLLKRIGYGLYSYLTIGDQLGFSFDMSILRGILPPIIPFKFNQDILQKPYSAALLEENKYLKYKTLFHHTSASEIHRLLKYYTEYYRGIETALSYKIRNQTFYANKEKFVKFPGLPYAKFAPSYVKLGAELSEFITSTNAATATLAASASKNAATVDRPLCTANMISADSYYVELFNKGLLAQYLAYKLGDKITKQPAAAYNMFNKLNIFNVDDLIRDIYNKRAIKKLFGEEFLANLVKKYGDFNIVNFVPKKEKSAIESEVVRIKEQEKANKENRCQHTDLTPRLRQLKSNRDIFEFLKELEPYIGDNKIRTNLGRLLKDAKGLDIDSANQPRTVEASHQEMVGGAEDNIDKLVKRFSLADENAPAEIQLDDESLTSQQQNASTRKGPIISDTMSDAKGPRVKTKKPGDKAKISVVDTADASSANDDVESNTSSEDSSEDEDESNELGATGKPRKVANLDISVAAENDIGVADTEANMGADADKISIDDFAPNKDSKIFDKSAVAAATQKRVTSPAAALSHGAHHPIDCKVCGLYLICPHSIYLLEYQIGLIATYDELQTLLEPLYSYSSDTKYIECAICAEQLFIKERFEVTNKPALIHGIRERDIWRDAQDFMYKFVLIKDVFNKQRIIEDMVNTCYPYIADKLLNYKNYSNVNNFRNIFGRILFSSYLLNITKKYPDKLLFDFSKYKENVPISELNSTISLINQYRPIFSKVIVNEDEFIITKQHVYINDFEYCFIMSLLVNKQPVTVSNALKLLPMEYFTSLNIQNEYNKKRSKVAAKANKISTKKKVGDILDSITDSAEQINTQQAAEVVIKQTIYNTLKPIAIGDFSKLMEQKIPLHTSGSRCPLKPDDLREVVAKLIYNKNVKFLTSNIWYTSLTAVDPNSPDFTPPQVLDAINVINARLCLRNNILSLRPAMTFSMPYGFDRRPPIALSSILHKDSVKRHKWDYLVYRADSLPKGYIEKNELKQIKDNRVIINKKMANMTALGGILPIDKYSLDTDTFQLECYADIGEDINSAIYDKYVANNERNNIVIYYTNKCPVTKGLHEMIADVCGKCGKRTTMSEEEISDYYAKYDDNYKREKADKLAADNVVDDADIQTFELDNKKDIEGVLDTTTDILTAFEYDEARYTEMVNIFSLLLGININQLKYLAQLEGHEFTLITLPNFVPKTMKNKQNYNIRLLDSWIVAYFQFRNTNNLASAQFAIYNDIYRKAHSKIEPNLLIKQMRYLLFCDMMQFNKLNSTLCVQILKEIVNDDKLLCKNNPIVQKAIPDETFVEEPDIIGLEERMMDPDAETEEVEVKGD